MRDVACADLEFAFVRAQKELDAGRSGMDGKANVQAMADFCGATNDPMCAPSPQLLSRLHSPAAARCAVLTARAQVRAHVLLG